MSTIEGIRLLALCRVAGITVGVQPAWLAWHTLGTLSLTVFLAHIASAATSGAVPWGAAAALSFGVMLAVNLTSVTHETGHVLAARLAGQTVRAVVLAPAGSLSVRSIASTANANLQTALAGSLINGACGLMECPRSRPFPSLQEIVFQLSDETIAAYFAELAERGVMAQQESASQNPQPLVPQVLPGSGPRPSRLRQDSQLVPQQQVLNDQVVPRAQSGDQRRAQESEKLERVLSIADLRPFRLSPSHNPTESASHGVAPLRNRSSQSNVCCIDRRLKHTVPLSIPYIQSGALSYVFAVSAPAAAGWA